MIRIKDAKIAHIILYVLYLPDQQLPQIRPTFPPIFLANTRCTTIDKTSLLTVNLISGVIDVPSSHVLVMGTDRERSLSAYNIVRIPRINRREQISATKGNRWSIDANRLNQQSCFLKIIRAAAFNRSITFQYKRQKIAKLIYVKITLAIFS